MTGNIFSKILESLNFEFNKKFGKRYFNPKPEDFGITKYEWRNGYLDVFQSVDLSYKHLLNFPFKFGIVQGNFDCKCNKLTTLKNGPKTVKGAFDCSYNQLTALTHGPKTVKGAYICKGNFLINLRGSPRNIGYSFICSNNELTSLKGSPRKITRKFDVSYNHIQTFEGGPTQVGSLFCRGTALVSLKYAPTQVKGKIEVPSNLEHEIPKYINVPQSIEFIRSLLGD